MHRRQLLELLERHTTRFIDESAYRVRTREFVETHANCFDRDLWPGHVTGSAWVVNPSLDHVLLLHHRKHDQWFQPGGHADGHADVLEVALRETSEETGLDRAHIRLVDGSIFDIDIHAIPVSMRGPEHHHYDFRFLVEIDDGQPIPGSEESHEIRWVALHHVARFNNNRSTHRMLEKTRRMRSHRGSGC